MHPQERRDAQRYRDCQEKLAGLGLQVLREPRDASAVGRLRPAEGPLPRDEQWTALRVAAQPTAEQKMVLAEQRLRAAQAPPEMLQG